MLIKRCRVTTPVAVRKTSCECHVHGCDIVTRGIVSLLWGVQIGGWIGSPIKISIMSALPYHTLAWNTKLCIFCFQVFLLHCIFQEFYCRVITTQPAVWPPGTSKQTGIQPLLELEKNCPGTFVVGRTHYEKLAIILIKNLRAFLTNTGITENNIFSILIINFLH